MRSEVRAGRQLIILYAIGLVAVLMVGSCQSPATWTPTEKTRDCLIDSSALPESWEAASGPGAYDLAQRILPGRAVEGMTVSFVQPEFDARSFHQVLLYPNDKDAAEHFRSEAPFGSSNLVTPWEKPRIPAESSVADQMRIECATKEVSRTFRICSAWAQYGPYVSDFDTWISPQYMSMDDLVHTLQAIDAKMASCLERYVDDVQ